MERRAPAVRRTALLPVPAERVWEALTDGDQLARWFGGQVDWDPRPGGGGTFRDDAGRRRHAVVRHVEPPRRLAFDWWPADDTDDTEDSDDDTEAVSTVELTLDGAGETTRLTVTETAASGALDVQACVAWDSRLEAAEVLTAELVRA